MIGLSQTCGTKLLSHRQREWGKIDFVLGLFGHQSKSVLTFGPIHLRSEIVLLPDIICANGDALNI